MVLTKDAESLFLSGRFPESERMYEEAIAELRAQGNALGLGEAMVSLSFVHGFRGQTGQSRALLAEVVELLEREPAGPELVRAYAQTTREHMLLGESETTLSWSGKTLGLAERFGMRDVVAMVLQFRGTARCQLGDLGGLDDLREALRMSLELGLGNETMRAHINYGDFVWMTEGPAKGLEVFRAGIDFGERRGITGSVMWIKGESLWMLFDLGEWDGLLRVADELISWDRAHGGSYFGVVALSYKARVLVTRGEVKEAASLKDEFLSRARDIRDPQILAPALVIAALIDRARGDHLSARRLIEEFEDVTRGQPVFRWESLPDALRALDGTGQTGLAEKLLEGTGESIARHRYGVLTAKALLAEEGGDLERALELHEEAAERWGEFEHALERGYALLGAGRCLVGLGRREEAAARLQEARDVFVGLQARPLIADADHWMEQGAALSS
jgi:tetratricopeptide (TPR) repeat protein